MITALFGEFLLLFQMTCVFFLFAYLFSKSRFYMQVLEHRATLAVQVFLALVFGLLSVYGMSSGISFYTATVNIRDFGPLAAGLACGPHVGIGAGLIGFAYRLSLGGTNVYAVAAGPLAAGIIGGLIYHYHDHELVTTKSAILITLVVESLISAAAILIRVLAGDTLEKIATVTINVAIPMIVMTSIAVGFFCYTLHNTRRELRMQREKLHLELEVESKRNLSTIINTIAYPVYVLDREHRFVLVNDSLCRFIGRPREEILGHTHRDIYRADDAERHWTWVEKAFRTHTPREEEISITRPDGQQATIISSSSVYMDSSGQEFVVAVIQDITERKKMQVALAESEEWYRILFAHTGTATIIINSDGTIDQANAEFSQMTGYAPAEIEGKMRLTQIAHADDTGRIKRYHIQRRIDAASVPSYYTLRILDSHGATKTLHAVVAMIPGTEKSIASFIDITEQKRSEETVRQMNRKLNLLSSITRHDIINQLMILKGFLALLRQKAGDPALLDYVDRSERATRSIEHQIIFTRDYQDLGVKDPVWQNVKGGITGAKGALPVGSVKIETGLTDLEIFADPLFEKVFYNLIDNSLRYGGEGLSMIRIRSEESADGLILTYEDNGVGIAENERLHLFERGFGKHTGFGLFLSKEVLSLTGITIEETGMPGKGARFVIRVPKGMYRFGNGQPA